MLSRFITQAETVTLNEKARAVGWSIGACLTLLIPGTLLAQSNVTVDQSIRSEKSRILFQAVGSDIFALVVEMFKQRPALDLPIIVSYEAEARTVLDDWAHPKSIYIHTTVLQDFPDQFAFQFAYEMGHVMLNPRRNSGIVDAICTVIP
jgi:hypothetical protein